MGELVPIEPDAHPRRFYFAVWHIAPVTHANRTRLPPPRPLVGREAELAALAAEAASGARLVTLTGPSGIGKSALAAAHARALVDLGACASALFVDLSDARDLDGLVDAALAAMGVPGGPTERARRGAGAAPHAGEALQALGACVVVLDGLDGVLRADADGAAAAITTWLALAHEATLIVTSGERLSLVDELVYPVGPLEAASAVELLGASARRASHGFAPRPDDGPHLAEIASLLDGIPLALVLAGSRLPVFGARALLHRLRANPITGALRQSARGTPARHATLEAAIAWSTSSLSTEEADALTALAVFRGGFTLASAQAVALPGRADAAELLERLRGRSLVTLRGGGERLDLYRPVRAFVEAHAPDEAARAAAERHAAYFVTTAERSAADASRSADARRWLLDERENVLAVVTRILEGDAPVTARAAEPALRALVALTTVLLASGPLASIDALLEPVLTRTRDSGADPRLVAQVTMLRGTLRRERDRDAAGSLRDLLAAESIALARGDHVLAATVGEELGRTLALAGEPSAAEARLEASMRAFAAAGLRDREATALAACGHVVLQAGRPFEARALFERALALHDGDPDAQARDRHGLGDALAELGATAEARAELVQSIEATRDVGDARGAARARTSLALALHDAGELEAAHAELHDAIAALDALGLARDAAIARGHAGVLAREQGHLAESYAWVASGADAADADGQRELATVFAIHLAGLDADVGRAAQATAALDAIARRPALGATARLTLGLHRASLAGALDAARRDAFARGPVPLLARLALRCLRRTPPSVPPPPPDDALLVGPASTWFRLPGGERVGLERRASLARILDRLVQERIDRPGAPLSAIAVLAAGWPDERVLPSAGAHRVRVAIATLRKMGLRDVLVTSPEGYLLSHDVPCSRA